MENLRKFTGSTEIPKKFIGKLRKTIGKTWESHRKTIGESSDNSLENHRDILGTSSCHGVSLGIRPRILAYLRVVSTVLS